MDPRRLILHISISITLIFAVTAFAGKNPEPPVFLLPVTKDKATSLYYTTINVGNTNPNGQNNPPLVLKMALDLGGSSAVLLGCSSASRSATYLPFRCNSLKCEDVKPDFCFKATTCGKYVNTSFSDRPINAGLGQDHVSLLFTDNGVTVRDSDVKSSLLLTCTDDSVVKPFFAVGMSGTIGLAKTLLSLPSQLADSHDIPRKMALCLPSKPGTRLGFGDLYIGGGPYFMPPYPEDVSKIFASTPLFVDQRTSEYLIDVESIEINGEAVAFDRSILGVGKKGHGGTKICTMVPYVGLHTSIYNAVTRAFTAKAKMTKVEAVKPFGACFDSKGLGESMISRRVPVIDLVLRGGAKWRIYGSNSLLKVKNGVVCLGFVDAGKNPTRPMVIGGRLMEDNVFEFDLSASKLYFSSSLLLHNSSCSHFRAFK